MVAGEHLVRLIDFCGGIVLDVGSGLVADVLVDET